MGSKNRIAKEIIPLILKDRKEGQWYVEQLLEIVDRSPC